MRRLLLAAVFVVAGLAANLGCARGSASEPAFTLDSEPTATVLRLSFFGGGTRTRIDYTLYGDGRLERVATDPAYPTKRQEVTLSPQQVRALITPAVEQGLAHTGQSQLDAKMRSGWAFDPKRPLGTPPIPAPPQDAGTAELELQLASYGPSRQPAKNLLRIEGVEVVAEELPGVPELQAWMGLFKAIKQAIAQGGHP